jgi:cytoskeletal protein RodZ
MSSLRNQRLQRKSRVQRRAIVKQLRSKVQQLHLRRSRQQRRFLGLDKLWGWMGMSSAEAPAKALEAAKPDTVDVAITAAETATAAATQAEVAVENGDQVAAVQAADTANEAAVLAEEAANKAKALGNPDSAVAVEAAETANNAVAVASDAAVEVAETAAVVVAETANKNGGNRSRKLRRQRRSKVQQRGGRAVSLNSALRLLKNYYARR